MLFEKIKLEEDEAVLQVVRKHWWIIFLETVLIVMLAVLPLIILSIILAATNRIDFLSSESIMNLITNHQAEVIFLYSSWLLSLWMLHANFWTDYYLDLWAITTRRVILVDQRGFFRRFISSFRLERLQDIEIRTVGIVQTFLNFGTISAQTAGSTENNFISTGLPDPRGLQAIIQRAMDTRLQKLGRGHSDAL